MCEGGGGSFVSVRGVVWCGLSSYGAPTEREPCPAYNIHSFGIFSGCDEHHVLLKPAVGNGGTIVLTPGRGVKCGKFLGEIFGFGENFEAPTFIFLSFFLPERM